MKVNFHIQRLVIEGSSRAEAMRVAEALRARLSEGTADLAARTAHIGRLDAGTLPHHSTPEQIGCHVAGRIWTNLKGPHHG